MNNKDTEKSQSNNNVGFIKYLRTKDARELCKRPYELALFCLIVQRAKWTDAFSADGLEPGEAMIGDHESCGLTRQQYRTALKNLKKWDFLTTKSTNKGTIAKLINTDVFDINCVNANHQANQCLTINQPSTNHQPTTNKERKKERNQEGKTSPKGIQGEGDSFFSEFWNIYPKKIAKPRARIEFERIVSSGVDPGILIEAIQTQVDWKHFANAAGEDMVPNPVKWLTDGRWEDEIAEPFKSDPASVWKDIDFDNLIHESE